MRSLRALPAFLLVAVAAGAQSRRPLGVDDLFTVEWLKTQAVSPDGEWVAVVIERTHSERETYKRDFLNGDDHADVWLVPRRGGERRNLTNGLADASGWWSPIWSPDGSRLAMLSTRGGDNVRLFVWERANGRVTRVSPHPVDLASGIESPAVAAGGGIFGAPPFAWISSTALVVAVLPDTMASVRFSVEHRTQRSAARAWPETERGRVAQVSVLESAAPPNAVRPRPGNLVRIELPAGRETALTNLSLDGQRRIFLSPSLTQAAILEGLPPVLPGGDSLIRLAALSAPNRLGVLPLAAGGGAWWIDSISAAPGSSPIWSPSGERVAVLAAPAGGKPARALVVVPGSRSVATAGGSDVRASALAWVDESTLLAFGAALSAPAAPPAPGNAGARPASPAQGPGWWVIAPGGASRSLTRGLRQVAPALVRLGTPARLFALADSALHQIDVGGAEPKTVAFASRIAGLLWPPPARSASIAANALAIEVKEGRSRVVYRGVLAGDGITFARVPPPPNPQARLTSFVPAHDLALFSTAGEPFPTSSDGPGLWGVDLSSGSSRELVALNAHLAGIVEPERRFVPYRGLEGDSLVADVLLPVGYEPGKRYPLVVHVYAGSVTRDTLEPRIRYAKNRSHPLNLQLLASRGYIVMTPSMPLSEDGVAKDPYMELPKGVIPAIDRLIDLGIADPARVGVMGQSFGGFSTYGLITQTTRFRAAVSLAGIANWISLYGAFDPRSRYTDDPQSFFAPGLLETGQVSLGATPWRDFFKYVRNSPIYYFDRVSTPLLIIQGDVDYVTMAQGEEAFTALQRLGKRGRFVRYWGEGHVLNSPANIRDMWKQIFAWFDEYLAAPPTKAVGDSK